MIFIYILHFYINFRNVNRLWTMDYNKLVSANNVKAKDNTPDQDAHATGENLNMMLFLMSTNNAADTIPLLAHANGKCVLSWSKTISMISEARNEADYYS